MQFLIDKSTSLGIGWNERPLDEADLHRLCRRFGIGVTEMSLEVSGFYYRVKGRDFIAVDCRLPAVDKLVVLFHELGHYLFHVPESGATANFHGVGRRTRKEVEADIFALCAIVPRFLIEGRSEELIDDGIPPAVLAARIEIYRKHGI